MNEVIELKKLSVGYGERKVLKDIEAHIDKGQFISILGPNGVGKTTLLRTMSRHLEKLGGAIIIDGKDINDYSQRELAKSLAVVLTTKLNTELFTGFEFAAMGRYPHTDFIGKLTDEDKERVIESLRLVNAGDLANRQMNQMSDGEKQKLYIARAICQNPKYIILDEPTSHLDLKHKMEVMSILRNSCREKGITIIASLHDIDLAARVSDQVALIKDGRIVDWGIPEEVLNDYNVQDLYDMDTVCYDRTLGTIEIKHLNGKNEKKVFCITGSGNGSVLFRSLLKSGFNVFSGVVHENDLDYHVARSLNIEITGAPAYETITEENVESCISMLEKADYVVDTGFVIKDLNRANVSLMERALEMSKEIYSLRDRDELRNLDLDNKKIVSFESDYGIIKSLCGKKTLC